MATKSKLDAKKKKTKSKTKAPLEKNKEKLPDKSKKKVEELLPKEPEETAAQKYQRELEEEKAKKSREERAFRQLRFLKRRELQAECVIRGLKFEDIAGLSTPQLAGWFTDHLDHGQDQNLLNEYDVFREKILTEKGVWEKDGLNHPSLKYGLAGKSEKWDDKALKHKPIELDEKPKKEREPKKESKTKRVEKDASTGIFKGTKKALTYELTKKGLSIEEILKQVTAKFVDANDKSIRIWSRRAKNL